MNRFVITNVLCAAASLLGAGNVVLAQEAEQEGLYIEAQPLSSALREFSEQTGLQIGYAAELAEGKETAGVAGVGDPEVALDTLLAESGLEHRFVNAETVVIRTAGASLAETEGSSDSGNALTTPRPVMMAQASAERDKTTDQEQQNSAVSQQHELPIEEIVVTGTNIRGAGPVGSQVLTFHREEIDLKGYATLPDLIQELTQNFNGGVAEGTPAASTANGSANNATGGSSINLRGLGNTSTLVLLNGQRLAPSGSSGSFIDISLIPVTAIERVEVLTDGASAIYGSDAIGGVVNFVLRKDYDGAETRLRHGFATQGGLGQYQVGQTNGKNWGNAYGLASYEYYHREPLKGEDRDFANQTAPGYELLPEQDRHSVLLNGGVNITDNFDLFGTGFYSSRKSGQLSFTADPTVVGISEGDNEQFGGSVGAALDFADSWRAELVGALNRNESIFRGRDLNEARSESTIISRASRIISADAKIDGPVRHLPGGEAKLAIGGHYRHEKFGDTFDELGISDSNLNPNPVPDASRDVLAFFGELYAPIVSDDNSMPGLERLEISVSGRYEEYSDFGSSVDPKVGAVWSPIGGVTVRGTWGTSFRAPLLDDLDESLNQQILINGIPNPQSPTGTSLVLYLLGFGNANLNPETAATWTGGIDFQPPALPNLQIATTYFDIDFEDKIESPGFPLLEVLTNPRFSPVLDLDPDSAFLAGVGGPRALNLTSVPGFGPAADFDDAQIVAQGQVQNLASVHLRGVDLSVSYRLDTENVGIWNLAVSGTYLIDVTEQLFQTDPGIDVVDTIDNPVDFRLNSNLSWSLNEFRANFGVAYVDGYRNDKNSPTGSVSSWTTANLTLGYDTRDNKSGFLANTKFLFYVKNILDTDPPFVTTSFASTGTNPVFCDPNAAHPDGRVLSVQVIKRW